ncbi:ABC transporter permease [Sulfurivirga sp.]|uniref:ABC transporter permease n=1 Tax=Sulfurivirga sp. TaxID=2614236 RepID=UPI0026014BDB|nr:ABC transporter permease [Sulfurivirga sp.]
MNWRGLWTLFMKESRRFLSVAVQTLFAPVVTTLLYLLVFGQLLDEESVAFRGVDYAHFLVPGLAMMALMQNAFANSSSSLIQSKMHGNIVFLLLAPLSPLEIYLAFLGSAVLRGLLVGLMVFLVGWLGYGVSWQAPGWILLFAVLSGAVMGGLGIMAGILSEKYDHLAAFQNFIVVPLTFLSGVFYSIHQLPPVWQQASHFNPFFYMVDGFRYGFFQQSDVPLGVSLSVTFGFLALVSAINLWLLVKGVKIRH